MNVDLKEFRSAFVAEADEHIAGVNSLLLEVERQMRAGKTAPRELRELMRLLHTLKGLSAMVGVEPIVVLSHKMENVIRAAERGGGVLAERAIETLLTAARAIAARVRAVGEEKTAIANASPDLLTALDALNLPAVKKTRTRASANDVASVPVGALLLAPAIASKLSASEEQQLREGGMQRGRAALRVDFTPSAAKAAAGLSITTVRERLTQIAEIVKVLPLTATAAATGESNPGGLVFALLIVTSATKEAIAEAAGTTVETVQDLLPPPSTHRALDEVEEDDATAAATLSAGIASEIPDSADISEELVDGTTTYETSRGILRVEVSRVDDAIDMLGELIVTRSRMAHAVERLELIGVDARELRQIMVDNARQLRELRAAILRVRMVPISAVLDRLQLVVRGLARTTGKQVRLQIDVGAAELDKTVAERLFPALVHLIRNAVDHGIESPEERAATSKDPVATVTIQSVTLDRNAEIRVSDDGRGIDRAAVIARSAAAAATTTATAQAAQITDSALLDLLCESGLSTRAEADATSGRGLGMDIVRKIVVQGLGGELLLSTQQGAFTSFTLRVPLTVAIVDAFIVRCAGARFAIPVPIVEEILEIVEANLVAGPRPNNTSAKVRMLARRGETVPIFDLATSLSLGARANAPAALHGLVIRRGHGELVGYAVERVLGQQEIVVRPLIDPLVASSAISGSTDLGDGQATIVLDLLALSNLIEGDKKGFKSAKGHHAA